VLGKMIYRREFGERGENVYAAGLLHDIGIIVEDQFGTDGFRQALRLSREERRPLLATEHEVLGFHHAQVGRAVTGLWGLPDELLASNGHHHRPDHAECQYGRLASTLFVADYLCQTKGFGYSRAPRDDRRCFSECLRRLDLKPMALELLLRETRLELKRMESRGVF